MSIIIALLITIGHRADRGLYSVSDAELCKIHQAVQSVGGLTAAYRGVAAVQFNDNSEDERYEALEASEECL